MYVTHKIDVGRNAGRTRRKAALAILFASLMPSLADAQIASDAATPGVTCNLTEKQKLTASDAATWQWFGYSVSVSGNAIVAGAPLGCVAGGGACGSAYVYRFNGNTWIEEAKLTPSDASDNGSGVSVSMSGNTFVLGASGADCATGTECGSAYVYRFDGSTWVEEANLTASDPTAGALFGFSVSVHGNLALVGAHEHECATGVQNCGAAYVYRFDGSTWIEEAKLTASDSTAGDHFGFTVSVSGDTAVVGAELSTCAAGAECGAAYVYRYNNAAWIEEAKLTASDAASADHFGYSVSVSGHTAVVGARLDGCKDGPSCGSAYVYRFDGATWLEEAKLKASDATAGDVFGASSSVSGDTVVVGANLAECPGGQTGNCGAAYVYRFDGAAWVEQSKLAAADAAGGDDFGFSVSVSGNTVVAGAHFSDCEAGSLCGSVYVFMPATCDDGLTCTTDSCSVNKDACEHTINDGSCLIDGACYNDGNLSLGNDCLACDAAGDNTAFTALADGTPCTDYSQPCVGGGVCQGGTCTIVPPNSSRFALNVVSLPDASYVTLAGGESQPGPTRAAGGGTCTLVDFEGFAEGQPIGTIAGTPSVRFDSSWQAAIDGDDGGSGQFANEPSPSTVAVHLVGQPDGVIDFDAGVYSVDVFYTAIAGALPITLTAWDCLGGKGAVVDVAVGNTVGTTTPGAQCVGDPGGFLCVWDSLQVLSGSDNIRSVVISSGTSNLFGLDDMTICANVPEPGVTSGNHFEWVRAITSQQDPDSVVAIGWAIAVDEAGNSYMTGGFGGTVTVGQETLTAVGGGDIFVAKHDPNGNLLWAKSAGGAGGETGTGIALDDAGDAYVTGHFQGTAIFGNFTLTSVADNEDIFVARYDATGNVIWAQSAVGDLRTFGGGIAVDSLGNSYVTGRFQGAISFGKLTLHGAGYWNAFVAKYDTDGNVLWVRSADGTTTSGGEDISVDALGNCYVVGVFDGTVTFGTTLLTSAGGFDMFVVKYDIDGNVLWATSAGGTWNDRGTGIAIDAAGNSHVTGSYLASATFGHLAVSDASIFVAKYSADGNISWVQSAGGPVGGAGGRDIALDVAGNSYVTGNLVGDASFGPFTCNAVGYAVFVAKYDGEGNTLWAQSSGGASQGGALGIAVDCAGNSYVTGAADGTPTFGTLTATGGAFVAKYHSDCPPEGCSCERFCGDINGAESCGNANDTDTDLVDYAMFANCFGLPPNHSQDCFCSDLNGDGTIDELDFAILVGLFESTSGNTPPSCP